MGLSSELSCESGSFSCCRLNPPQVFSVRGLRLYFPELEPWVVGLSRSPVVPPGLSAHKCGDCPVPKPLPLRDSSPQGCPSPPLLPVWVSVSSLTPWLSDFHTVRFSVSSACFLFLNCCPSVDCGRRHSMSPYASILARSPTSYTALYIPMAIL